MILRGVAMVFLLSLVGTICWGIAPIFVKMGLANLNPAVGLLVRTIITAGLIFSWMCIDGSITQFRNVSMAAIIILAIEAVLATFIGDLSYFAAIKKGSVAMVTTIMASAPLITIIFSVLFLGEVMTIKRFLGTCFVILGIILAV